MKKAVLLIVLFAAFSLYSVDADHIVSEADKYRGFSGSFAQESEAAYYKNGTLDSSQKLKVYIKDKSNSLVKFLGPGREEGRIMLMSGNNVWFYIPGTRNPIRLTPQQRLLGQASNGDVARTNYSEDYTAILEGEDEAKGFSCYRLILTAKTGGTTYQKIEYYVEKSTNRPVKALFFAKSGKLLKTGLFKVPRTIMGTTIMTELHLTDEIKLNEKTVISVSGINRDKLPEAWFNKNYLKRIK